MTLKVDTFIGRLIRHIADKHFAMIRSAGLFSNRWKKQYSCSTLLNVSVANAAFVIKHGVSSPSRRLYEPEATTSYLAL